MLDIDAIRREFPILHQEVNGHPLVYLDNAATSQKPREVIEALQQYYMGINSNVHRGAHTLADLATREFEETREAVQAFLKAKHVEEIIFTKGTTEAINLVAQSYGRTFLKAGDEVIVSAMEHHANIVPWQMACEVTGAQLRVIPINEIGVLDYSAYEAMLSPKVKIVAVMHASNALGTINDVARIIRGARQAGAVTLIDGAQAGPHFEIDVQALNCDFYVFSAHKMYGPTGIGILYGKKDLLEAMPPYQGGGEMIKEVSFEKTTFNTLPFKFEAGTPNIADTIALKKALEFINRLGKGAIALHEHQLLEHATCLLSQIDGVRLVGTAPEKVSVVSFVVEGMHHYDVGMMLDARGIAIRTGHHCAMPLMNRLNLEGTARASFAVYNTLEEVEKFAESLERIAGRRKTAGKAK
jgi:cysteine desulfurase/selenocysteine lyase